jgi:large subunit ribosomal protein L25
MAQQTELEITPRTVLGKASKRLRKQGIIPANVFGHHEPSQAVQVDGFTFERMLRSHKANSILALRQPNAATQTALIRHIQREPRSGKIIHVDFFRVSLTERINVKVPLHFVGEAPAVKNEGGVLLHLLDSIEIESEAGEIPEYFEVDVTPLAEIDDILHVEDIKLSPNVILLTDPKEGVAKVAATRAEIAEEAEEVQAEAAAPATPAAASEAPAEE